MAAQTSSAFTCSVAMPAAFVPVLLGRRLAGHFPSLILGILPMYPCCLWKAAQITNLLTYFPWVRTKSCMGQVWAWMVKPSVPVVSISRVLQAPCTSSEGSQLYPLEIWLCEYAPSCAPEKSIQKDLILLVDVLKKSGATPVFWPMEMSEATGDAPIS